MKDEKRRARLIELLSRLESGVDIQVRDMKSVLTEDELSRYEDLWQSEKSGRNIQKPDAIKRYELMLRQAYAADARFEKIRKRNGFKDHLLRRRMAYESEHIVERAFEFYLELIQSGYAEFFADASRTESSLLPSNLPVLKDSKSAYNNSDEFKKKKREYKIIVLQEALDCLDRVLVDTGNEQMMKDLKDTLNKASGKNKFNLDGFKV